MDQKKSGRLRRAPHMPAAFSRQLAQYHWTRNTNGESGSVVYRLHGKTGAPDLYLKHGSGDVAAEIAAEEQRMRWLATHVAVPAVVHFECTHDQSWLLMTARAGETTYQSLASCTEDKGAVVDRLAEFLRGLHSIAVDQCPFDSRLCVRLAHARQRIDAGLVDVSDFDDAREGWSAEDLWTALRALGPSVEHQVVTHGDFSLGNILMKDGQITGCMDLARVGIGDPYQDLAIMWNNLSEFGSGLQQRFLDHYGIADVDDIRLQRHLMLDEFF